MSALPKPLDLDTNPNEGDWSYVAGEYEVSTTATPPALCGTLNLATETRNNHVRLDRANSSYEDAAGNTYDLQVLNSNG
ncbi:MAG: hypothetical protein ACRD4I_17940, partial [Candidatus Angelobacter sp.]